MFKLLWKIAVVVGLLWQLSNEGETSAEVTLLFTWAVSASKSFFYNGFILIQQ